MSNEAKFTKGEWKVRNGSVAIIDKSDSQSFGLPMEICWIEDSFCQYAFEAEANAHLIAAAPEMYEELQEVSNWLNSQLGMGDWHKDIEKLLAKARGEHDIN